MISGGNQTRGMKMVVRVRKSDDRTVVFHTAAGFRVDDAYYLFVYDDYGVLAIYSPQRWISVVNASAPTSVVR